MHLRSLFATRKINDNSRFSYTTNKSAKQDN